MATRTIKACDQFLISKTKTGKVGRYHLAFRNVTGIERQRGGKWLIKNHTTEHAIDLEKVANIALFGVDKSVKIPMQFLQDLNEQHVALVLADLSSTKIQILEPHHAQGIDHVTGLHEIRRSDKKTSHVARELIKAQCLYRGHDIPEDLLKKLSAAQTPTAVRFIEAELANQYWKNFYRKICQDGLSRREDHPINEALNATSHQLAQVVSRHLINHRLPLEFGILHTTNCALVYDLMEPFRGFAEQSVLSAYQATWTTSDTSQIPSLLTTSLQAFTQELEVLRTYRQGTEKKSLQQLIEMTVMNLINYGESQYNQNNSSRFWVPKIGRRKFLRETNN